MDYTKLEQLTVGTEFVEVLHGHLYITYKVVGNDGKRAYMESLSPVGYDFELTQEDIDIRLDIGVLPLYSTMEAARDGVKLDSEY